MTHPCPDSDRLAAGLATPDILEHVATCRRCRTVLRLAVDSAVPLGQAAPDRLTAAAIELFDRRRVPVWRLAASLSDGAVLAAWRQAAPAVLRGGPPAARSALASRQFERIALEVVLEPHAGGRFAVVIVARSVAGRPLPQRLRYSIRSDGVEVESAPLPGDGATTASLVPGIYRVRVEDERDVLAEAALEVTSGASADDDFDLLIDE